MFDLFGGNTLTFFVAEEEVANTIERVNRFNISRFEIISRATENDLWRIKVEAHPDVIKALRIHLKGDVVFQEKKA